MGHCSTTGGKTYRHLDLEEREEISVGLEIGESQADIATRLGRDRSTISREIKRNSPPIREVRYRGNRAHIRFEERKIAGHARARLKSSEIRNYVEEKIGEGWTPELIAGRLPLEKLGYSTNYESIYQWIYVDRRDLIRFLPRAHRTRRKRGSALNKRSVRVPNRIMIQQRPPEASDRKEPGHWEADTAVSRQSKAAIAIMQERTSRLCFIASLSAKTATAMHEGLTEKLQEIPSYLLKTITYDNGTENAKHESTNAVLGTLSFFCQPYHSWEKGGVENCIGLVRRYYPKKTDWASLTQADCDRLAHRLNTRPRKCLGFRTAEEVFVALTG